MSDQKSEKHPKCRKCGISRKSGFKKLNGELLCRWCYHKREKIRENYCEPSEKQTKKMDDTESCKKCKKHIAGIKMIHPITKDIICRKCFKSLKKNYDEERWRKEEPIEKKLEIAYTDRDTRKNRLEMRNALKDKLESTTPSLETSDEEEVDSKTFSTVPQEAPPPNLSFSMSNMFVAPLRELCSCGKVLSGRKQYHPKTRKPICIVCLQYYNLTGNDPNVTEKEFQQKICSNEQCNNVLTLKKIYHPITKKAICWKCSQYYNLTFGTPPPRDTDTPMPCLSRCGSPVIEEMEIDNSQSREMSIQSNLTFSNSSNVEMEWVKCTTESCEAVLMTEESRYLRPDDNRVVCCQCYKEFLRKEFERAAEVERQEGRAGSACISPDRTTLRSFRNRSFVSPTAKDTMDFSPVMSCGTVPVKQVKTEIEVITIDDNETIAEPVIPELDRNPAISDTRTGERDPPTPLHRPIPMLAQTLLDVVNRNPALQTALSLNLFDSTPANTTTINADMIVNNIILNDILTTANMTNNLMNNANNESNMSNNGVFANSNNLIGPNIYQNFNVSQWKSCPSSTIVPPIPVYSKSPADTLSICSNIYCRQKYCGLILYHPETKEIVCSECYHKHRQTEHTCTNPFCQKKFSTVPYNHPQTGKVTCESCYSSYTKHQQDQRYLL